MDRSLTRHERLRRRPEFLKVQQTGIRTRGRYLTLFVLVNRLSVSRLGVIATRRLGCAVYRNRTKRVIREIFRLNKGLPGLDIVVLPGQGFLSARFLTLQTDFRDVLQRFEQSHTH